MNFTILPALLALVSATQLNYMNKFTNDISSRNYYRNRVRSIPSAQQQIYTQMMNNAETDEEAIEAMKAFAGRKSSRGRGNRFARSHYLRNM